MAQVRNLFDKNFLEYASYVIKDRAIPDIDDGLKPVQRRILYTLYQMDDGTTHKAAAVIGRTMFLHPHGDTSIGEALVNLANKDLFIEKQGNFGNIFTGDAAAAPRYLECSLMPFAKGLLFNDEITDFMPSYDGKNLEPAALPAKAPLVLVLGAEGIAVGMSTKILPHNFIETLNAVKNALAGEAFCLLPDFPTGALADCSQYNDGLGKVSSRALLDLSDPKRIVIRALPFGCTVETLIQSIEDAAKKGKLKISSINDYTAENVEIEIELPRGVYAEDAAAALYAFTACQTAIHANCLVIKDRKPTIMTVTDIVRYHAERLKNLLHRELSLEKAELLAKARARTLERIFIEERIYKSIETMKSEAAIEQAVAAGLQPFESKEFDGPLTKEDLERLLKIPIRRISLFDIEKNRKELQAIAKRVSEIDKALANIAQYAIGYLETLAAEQANRFPRKTVISEFKRVDLREAALRNLRLRYDSAAGYLGTDVAGGELIAEASEYDRVLVIEKTGHYKAIEMPKKLFIGKNALYVGLADKETLDQRVFNVLYKNKENSFAYIKRFKITQFILGRVYTHIVPENCELLDFGIGENLSAVPAFKQPSLIKDEEFPVSAYLIKGVQAQGVRLKNREVLKAKFKTKQAPKSPR